MLSRVDYEKKGLSYTSGIFPSHTDKLTFFINNLFRGSPEIIRATIEDSDQPGYSPRLIRRMCAKLKLFY